MYNSSLNLVIKNIFLYRIFKISKKNWTANNHKLSILIDSKFYFKGQLTSFQWLLALLSFFTNCPCQMLTCGTVIYLSLTTCHTDAHKDTHTHAHRKTHRRTKIKDYFFYLFWITFEIPSKFVTKCCHASLNWSADNPL